MSTPTTSGAWKPSACILCECNCGIEVQLGGEAGRHLVRVRGDKAHPASQGYACEKPSRLDHYQNGRDRLTTPLRRRADGGFEPIGWDVALREVAQRFAAVRDTHGGESILYYGGGAQGNHLPGGYARATRAVLGSRYRSNALAQEKTGEFWVSDQMTGTLTRSDFEHCEVAVFIGKNPWFSHGIPRARVTLRAIASDPARCLIVIDPRRSETAELADIHLQPKPGTDAWLLAAMVATLFQEGLLAEAWLAEHADGLDAIRPHFERIPIARYSETCGVPEQQLRQAVRRIARAQGAAFAEDLGVQMNRHSTLVSWLHRLLAFGTGNFGRRGGVYAPASLMPLASPSGGRELPRSPVTGLPIIGGLVACNAIPDEILGDHPKRFRAMLVEAANPAHSLADGPRMREALAALELLVVVDVAMTETARLAHYVLPVATQFEKAEATFFNFEFPRNTFQLRPRLLHPPDGLFSEAELHARLVEALGAMPEDAVKRLREAWSRGRAEFRDSFFALLRSDPSFFPVAPVALYRAIGDRLPEGLAEGAALWAIAQLAVGREGEAIRRAGIEGHGPEQGDALFDAILASPRGMVFAVDDWDGSWKRIARPGGRIQLSVPALFEELDSLSEGPPAGAGGAFPFVLSAGERRSFTANTLFRSPEWRRKDAQGALRISPADAARLGVADGERVRLSTKRGSTEVPIEISERMQPGHVSLPNGHGLDVTGDDGALTRIGVAPNELTAGADRDPFAGTPWHKYVPARVEAIGRALRE